MDKFTPTKYNEYIDSLKLNDSIKSDIDDVYKRIVMLAEPRWMNPKYNISGKRFPCCYKGNPDKPKKVEKIVKNGKFADCKLQKS